MSGMPPRDPGAPRGAQSVIQGLVLLGRGRPEGLRHFDASPQGVLSGLAPWIAFLLVGSATLALRQHPVEGATVAAISLCSLLLPPVLSEWFARLWRRDMQWLRYVTASLWCAWLMPVAYLAGLVLAAIALAAGLPQRSAQAALLAVLAGYWLWLHFFLARAGLQLDRTRATVLVVAQVAGYLALLGIAGGFSPDSRLGLGA